ncbi:hypothetical protein UY3_12717 [Chelonia mydas]|uniref:Uncharacterized protein n=1 Tax=Chelonia mydas TaxID=8469 RepID=M7BDE2_CHEMY|nr:hypothetical protein UY3_12717 [Chelonia mydas]
MPTFADSLQEHDRKEFKALVEEGTADTTVALRAASDAMDMGCKNYGLCSVHEKGIVAPVIWVVQRGTELPAGPPIRHQGPVHGTNRREVTQSQGFPHDIKDSWSLCPGPGQDQVQAAAGPKSGHRLQKRAPLQKIKGL